MIPDTFHDFFLGSMGAAAALIGLLFVAIAVAPERVFGPDASTDRQLVARSAFGALIVAFFVSTVALIPGANLGYVLLPVNLVYFVSTLARAVHLWRSPTPRLRPVRTPGLLLAAAVVYGGGIYAGIVLLRRPCDASGVATAAYLLLTVYGIGLARSWELLGGHRAGLLARLILHEQDSADADREHHEPTANDTKARSGWG